MTKDERQKAEEILKKRRAAEKGLKAQTDNQAPDPAEHDPFEEQKPDGEALEKAAVAGMALRKSG